MSEISNVLRYHLGELEIIRNATDPRRVVPNRAENEHNVLDVGCGIGQTLLAVELQGAALRCGIDIDEESIAYGRSLSPQLDLRVAAAEQIPYPDKTFDLLISRVALPYTNIGAALTEAHRVLRAGGRLWIVLHPWAMERERIAGSLRSRSLKGCIDRAYVMLNSLAVHATGHSIARPWSGTHESFQTRRGIARLLHRTGFDVLKMSNGRHFLVEGRRS
jgi:SAM-dependent methyltransferase